MLAEAKVYKILQGQKGIPKLYQVCSEGGYNILVMELLGPSVEGLFQNCNRKFSIPTLLAIAEQMIDRIETFHYKGLLHRDIKPDNFVIGTNETANLIYIIDYGLAKRFRSLKSHLHIPMREGKKLIGTARYSSVNTHLGFEQSRRDDLECLGYTLLYLARGSLPWQGLGIEDKKEKYEKILNMKTEFHIETLCQGLPIEFARYMYYCRELKFEDKPDYKQLKSQFRECLNKIQVPSTKFVYDWNLLKSDFKSSPRKMQASNDTSYPGSPAASRQNIESESFAGKLGECQIKEQRQKRRKFEISNLLASLPPGLRPILKKSQEQEDLKNEKEFEESKISLSLLVPKESNFTFMNPQMLSPIAAESDTCEENNNFKDKARLKDIIENVITRQETVNNKILRKPRNLEELSKFMKDMDQAIVRKFTREMSEKSSCNLKTIDIGENSSLFGIF